MGRGWPQSATVPGLSSQTNAGQDLRALRSRPVASQAAQGRIDLSLEIRACSWTRAVACSHALPFR